MQASQREHRSLRRDITTWLGRTGCHTTLQAICSSGPDRFVAIPVHQGTHPVTTSTKAKCQAVGDGQNQSIVGLGVFDLDQCANCDGVVGFMSRTSVTEDAVFSFSLTRPPAWWPFFFQAELSTVPSRERNHTHRVKTARRFPPPWSVAPKRQCIF
jgi:hypothetical protein